MSWTNQYVGIPYELNGREMDALDCWGLVRQVFTREVGVDLPPYTEQYTHTLDGDAFSSILGEEHNAWVVVDGDPEEMDVAWCRIAGVECHVGVMLSGGLMLHAMYGSDSCIVRTSTPAWQRRILRCYRLQ